MLRIVGCGLLAKPSTGRVRRGGDRNHRGEQPAPIKGMTLTAVALTGVIGTMLWTSPPRTTSERLSPR